MCFFPPAEKGAIGGIADQPLRSFSQAPEVSSPTQRATGIIQGVGKGLMGVVIKPLGGAAEFVSQTGQGETGVCPR